MESRCPSSALALEQPPEKGLRWPESVEVLSDPQLHARVSPPFVFRESGFVGNNRETWQRVTACWRVTYITKWGHCRSVGLLACLLSVCILQYVSVSACEHWFSFLDIWLHQCRTNLWTHCQSDICHPPLRVSNLPCPRRLLCVTGLDIYGTGRLLRL